ncbi:MAG: hypothetical protein G01um101433_1075 [Parcubacteria group bacterium Gr01-1014_33]|nr:MAG: hypothetical protein G01um101433_1075 [Parcubacteria group bacterium Gr01-1014_33]
MRVILADQLLTFKRELVFYQLFYIRISDREEEYMAKNENRYHWYIVKSDKISLVPNNPNVVSLSNRLGWKTGTLIKRV